ncbi:MAG: GAF domain-containing protein, partial [Myxococcota bacterium]
VEQQHNDLATLYIASYRLNATLSRDEILATIKEIVTNLVGSEQVVVYETTEDGNGMHLVASSGVGDRVPQEIDFERDLVGRIARSEERFLTGENSRFDEEARAMGLNACVPMRVQGRLVGAVAIFKLLQQKGGWADVDHQLFELLGHQAAVALFCSGLMEQR